MPVAQSRSVIGDPTAVDGIEGPSTVPLRAVGVNAAEDMLDPYPLIPSVCVGCRSLPLLTPWLLLPATCAELGSKGPNPDPNPGPNPDPNPDPGPGA